MSTPAARQRPGMGRGFGGPGRPGMSMPVERPKDFRNTVAASRSTAETGEDPDRLRDRDDVGERGVHRVRPEDPRKRDRRPVQRGHRKAAPGGVVQAAGDRPVAVEGRAPARRHDQGNVDHSWLRSRFRSSRHAARPGRARLPPGRHAQLGSGLRDGRRGAADRVPDTRGRGVQARPAPSAVLRPPLPWGHPEPRHQRHRQCHDDSPAGLEPTAELGPHDSRCDRDDVLDQPVVGRRLADNHPAFARRDVVRGAALPGAIRRPVGAHRDPERPRRRDVHRSRPGAGVREERRLHTRSSTARTSPSTRRASAAQFLSQV